MKLLIETQVYENYGSEENPYWKPKGGEAYVVKAIDEVLERISGNCSLPNDLESLIDSLRDQVEIQDPMYIESIIATSIVEDDFLTRDERLQVEFEGFVKYPAHELTC